jgi:hypothetical protein
VRTNLNTPIIRLGFTQRLILTESFTRVHKRHNCRQ